MEKAKEGCRLQVFFYKLTFDLKCYIDMKAIEKISWKNKYKTFDIRYDESFYHMLYSYCN